MAFLPMTGMNLKTAINVASKFDIILITEMFSLPAMNQWLREELEEKLGVPPGTFRHLVLEHLRITTVDAPEFPKVPKPPLRTIADVPPGALDSPPFRSTPPPRALEVLQRENAFDVDLYAWARGMVEKRIMPFEGGPVGHRHRHQSSRPERRRRLSV